MYMLRVLYVCICIACKVYARYTYALHVYILSASQNICVNCVRICVYIHTDFRRLASLFQINFIGGLLEFGQWPRTPPLNSEPREP